MFEKLFQSGTPSTLLESAFADVSAMLQHSAKMCDLAVGALLDNAPLEVDLDAMDDRVDEGERMVRRTVLEHLSVNPDQDLVASLVLVSMVQDVERVGDFARGLAELVPLARGAREGAFADELRAIYGEIRPFFDMTETAFDEDDAQRAEKVVVAHRAIKARLQTLTRDVAASDLSADMAVVYASAARILRRVSAHLSNICSTVIQPYDRIRHGDEDV
jgi:Na+/phosphate symporter